MGFQKYIQNDSESWETDLNQDSSSSDAYLLWFTIVTSSDLPK